MTRFDHIPGAPAACRRLSDAVRPLIVATLSLVALHTTGVFAVAAPAADERPTGFVAQVIGMSSDDSRRLFVEEQMHRCMTAAGLPYTRQEPPAEERDSRDRRQRRGYGVSTRGAEGGEALRRSVRSDLTSLSTADRQRWVAEYGRCQQSSLDAAERKVEQALSALPDDLREEVLAFARLSHPSLAQPRAMWSRCLARAGFAFDHPVELFGAVEARNRSLGARPQASDLARVQETERKLALTDWDCTQTFVRPATLQLLNDLEVRAAAAGAPGSPFAE